MIPDQRYVLPEDDQESFVVKLIVSKNLKVQLI